VRALALAGWMIRLLEGDCRVLLPTLPAASVHCVVTSPPYWGLRDYGTATWEGGDAACAHQPPRGAVREELRAWRAKQSRSDDGGGCATWSTRDVTVRAGRACPCGARRIDQQLGLEPTPEAYVATMVGVFREVRRVLRDDGTLWLNMGSSYAAGDTSPSPSHARGRAPACDSDDRGRADCRRADRACFCCDDAHRAASLIHHARTAHTALSARQIGPPLSQTGRDTGPPDSARASRGASLLDAPASTTLSTNGHGLDVSVPEAPASAYHAWLHSFAADVLPSVCSSCLNHTMLNQQFKPKDMVPMPWILASALQADGWFLRADIIWSKPNPMPESVTDRPTKAHEYVFLLSKAARYFYDADAVRESFADARQGCDGGTIGRVRNVGGRRDGYTTPSGIDPSANGGRNLRSVWSIPSAPFPDAHFATFPPALASRCIQAGCPMGGTVLDPFAGSGTTGQVAEALGRHSVLLELSPAYVRMAADRTAQYGLFAQGSPAVC
jgi:DNA modification methylase